MDNKQVAQALLKIAKELTGASPVTSASEKMIKEKVQEVFEKYNVSPKEADALVANTIKTDGFTRLIHKIATANKIYVE